MKAAVTARTRMRFSFVRQAPPAESKGAIEASAIGGRQVKTAWRASPAPVVPRRFELGRVEHVSVEIA
jgi:hypothetical protein